MESEDKFVILADYPYSTLITDKHLRKIRDLCVKYDLHERFIPLYQGSYYNGKYRQIGVIDLLYIKVIDNIIDSQVDYQYPDNFIDVDVVEINGEIKSIC